MLREKQFLMIPGPTPVSPRTLRACAAPMINHRGEEFAKLWLELQENLKKVFQTKNDIIIYPAAGTGAMEASIVNAISPTDKVLAISIGAFGDRFAEIAKIFGAEVIRCDFPWGEAAAPSVVEKKLQENKDTKVVLITHNETSTGVVNNIEKIAQVVKKYNCLFVVDAISSLGAVDLKTDEWGIDLVVAGSQKALMLPPGLSFISVSPFAWEKVETSTTPKYYWQFKLYKKWMPKNQTPYTPALPQLFGLQESLKILLDEIGLENNFKRHKILAKATREGVKALGFEMLCTQEECASPCVTAILGREDIEIKKLRRELREKYNIITAGGQGPLEDKIFRIGHLGFVDNTDIIATLSALEMLLFAEGIKVALGSGVAKAQEVFLQ